MGSSTSKAAKTASKLSAANTARKYPTRPPPPGSNRTNVPVRKPVAQEPLGPTVYPEPSIAEAKTHKIEQDSQDPDLGLRARLQSLGPVQPNPTLSNTSTFNLTSRPALQHARNQPTTPSLRDDSQTQTNRSSQDPSLAHSNFQPSASNPGQSIFPTQEQNANARENPAVALLTARKRLADDAEYEFSQVGKKGAQGRQFLDVITLRQILIMRDEMGMDARKIEEDFGLRKGAVERLGRRGVVGVGS